MERASSHRALRLTCATTWDLGLYAVTLLTHIYTESSDNHIGILRIEDLESSYGNRCQFLLALECGREGCGGSGKAVGMCRALSRAGIAFICICFTELDLEDAIIFFDLLWSRTTSDTPLDDVFYEYNSSKTSFHLL